MLTLLIQRKARGLGTIWHSLAPNLLTRYSDSTRPQLARLPLVSQQIPGPKSLPHSLLPTRIRFTRNPLGGSVWAEEPASVYSLLEALILMMRAHSKTD
jgi:hypothetical protein